MSQSEWFCISGLKVRGWTDRGIRLFLGEPDKKVPNPHYKSASPMRLYLKARVEEAEETEKFIEFLESGKKRKTGSRKAVETKKQRLLKEVGSWDIEIQKEDDIQGKVISSYNEFKEEMLFERGHEYTPASRNSSKDFLNRITVNYIRHNLSEYDNKLDVLFGRVGKTEAYRLLNKKIHAKIAEIYPRLSEECNAKCVINNSSHELKEKIK